MTTIKMNSRRTSRNVLLIGLLCSLLVNFTSGMGSTEKKQLREKVLEMFNHAYRSYMDHAYPADELMPLSCKGRHRGIDPSRGDIDDVLGNFSLTLIDTLDTLALLGLHEEFERAVRLVIQDVTFDSDIVVSVFETNIRVLGGLLGGHTMARWMKESGYGMEWYEDDLLEKAKDLGYRLLPAFNTSTGIPFPRVNLRYGLKAGQARTGHERDTCTACAGTMILEFAALSRMTGVTIFEEKARRAMETIWKQRHRTSDLVGMVINIHNGDWVRRESGVGAGIDSYYEYLLKAYIMLGDETYLDRFNKHYESIMKYVIQGPMLVDVHMHKPLSNSKNFMDALLAFWPGLQVLKGDIKSAIEIHEMLYQVTQRHNFLPEAFTTDFRVHWGQHPLRPEFLESTYFIYKATSDPYYLEVGKTVLENLDRLARVNCGFAAIKDVTTGQHEDQMDSYVLAETFKYLYLLFSEKEEVLVDIDDYVFTTEAHLLPLSLSIYSSHYNNDTKETPRKLIDEDEDEDEKFQRSCPNTHHAFPDGTNYAHTIRSPLKNMVESVCPKPRHRRKLRLRATDFMAGNKDQLNELQRMGIRIVTMKDGRVQLLHTAAEATSAEDAEDGMLFMQEMIELSKQQQQEVQQEPRVVQLLSAPFLGNEVYNAGPAQFGYDLKINEGIEGQVRKAVPFKACGALENKEELKGKIAFIERGECMFIDKARHLQAAGVIGAIVIDHNVGSTSETSPLFAMSGDGKNDVTIPMLFLFRKEGDKLSAALEDYPNVLIFMAYQAKPSNDVMKGLLKERDEKEHQKNSEAESCGQPSAQTQSTNADVEEAKLLLNKYMTKMNLGDIQVQVKQNIPRSKSESLLKNVKGPDDQQQNYVDIDDMVDDIILKGTEDQKVGQVYKELINLLNVHTNFNHLQDQMSYLKALEELVKATFSKGEQDLGTVSQDKLTGLSTLLKLKNQEDYIQTDADEEDDDEDNGQHFNSDERVNNAQGGSEREGHNGHHYATEEDLNEAPTEKLFVPMGAKVAPDWMGLQKGQVFVSSGGTVYVRADDYNLEETTAQRIYREFRQKRNKEQEPEVEITKEEFDPSRIEYRPNIKNVHQDYQDKLEDFGDRSIDLQTGESKHLGNIAQDSLSQVPDRKSSQHTDSAKHQHSQDESDAEANSKDEL